MGKLVDKIKLIIEAVFGVMGIVLILIATYAVFARNILKASAPWTDETMKAMFVWVIFISSAIVFVEEGMIAMTVVEDSLSKKRKILGVVKAFQFLLTLIISILLTVQSVQIVSTQMSSGAKTAIVGYPIWFINLGFLLGSVLTIIFAIYKLIDCKKYFTA